jgi:very-short-patch-repair endonuclease
MLVDGARRRLQNQRDKNLNSLIMLTLWLIWRERNCRVFDNIYKSLHQIIKQIKADAQHWSKTSEGRLTILVE